MGEIFFQYSSSFVDPAIGGFFNIFIMAIVSHFWLCPIEIEIVWKKVLNVSLEPIENDGVSPITVWFMIGFIYPWFV